MGDQRINYTRVMHFDSLVFKDSVTWDPLNTGTELVLSNGNLTVSHPNPEVWFSTTLCTKGTTDKRIFGFVWDTPYAAVNEVSAIGFASLPFPLTQEYIPPIFYGTLGGADNTSIAWYGDGTVWVNTLLVETVSGISYSSGTQLLAACDCGARLAWFKSSTYWNGSSLADPTTGSCGFSIPGSGPIFAGCTPDEFNDGPPWGQGTADFSPSTVPTGYKRWSDG